VATISLVFTHFSFIAFQIPIACQVLLTISVICFHFISSVLALLGPLLIPTSWQNPLRPRATYSGLLGPGEGAWADDMEHSLGIWPHWHRSVSTTKYSHVRTRPRWPLL